MGSLALRGVVVGWDVGGGGENLQVRMTGCYAVGRGFQKRQAFSGTDKTPTRRRFPPLPPVLPCALAFFLLWPSPSGKLLVIGLQRPPEVPVLVQSTKYIMHRAARPLARLATAPLALAHHTPSFTFASRLRLRPRRQQPTTTTFRPFTTTPANMAANAQTLIDLAKARRSYYPLSKDLTITPARVQEIVKDLLDQVPSSFNSQSNRVVVLFGAEHEKLWDFTTEILKAIVPADQFESTAGKMAMFKAAAGTVRFFLSFPSPLLFPPFFFLFLFPFSLPFRVSVALFPASERARACQTH